MKVSKLGFLIVAFIIFSSLQSLFAGEGMWLPQFLKALNEKEMKSMGMKINAEDIYSVNKGSLKDAIVQFGGGCTGEIISSKGLILTNHHCGFSYIQSHSSVEKNLIKDGYWAKDYNSELACAGLTATLIVRIEEVTKEMLKNITPDMKDNQRRLMFDRNQNELLKNIQKKTFEEVSIRSFYNGNQFFAFVTLTYKDVRLVGTPPESIGKFGADTDNWVWPRHTGDFSIFRIYAGKNNLPADFSKENVPYIPKHSLPISLDGVEAGDFTMIFGFPGRTNEYLTKEGVRQITEVQNPVRIKIRDQVLKIMDKYMRSSVKTKIQYSALYAGIANYWKKWIGESQGVKFTNGLERKQRTDEEFNKRVQANPNWASYRSLVSDLETQYQLLEPMAVAKEYYAEGFQRNIDLFNCYSRIRKLSETYEGRGEETFRSKRNEMFKSAEGIFKNFDIQVEKEIFKNVLKTVVEGVDSELLVPYLRDQLNAYNNDYATFTENLYTSSAFTTPDSLRSLNSLEFPQWINRVQSDPVWKFYEELNYFLINGIQKRAGEHEENIADLRRSHMAALMEVFPERKFYPDANSTLRVAYGKVEGFLPRDGVTYLPKTYLEGVIEKYVPEDYEFDVHPKLRSLFEKKDFGVYGEKGKMPLAFIASNHTTGGNSGSPAIDAHGNLIGLNFDRVWEGTMSDINYDVRICRNIMVDARYVLFIVDKFAGADHILSELKLVHPKNNKRGKQKL
ncbi:MAG: S46 family peptidase [Saprospiraceae bacterium]